MYSVLYMQQQGKKPHAMKEMRRFIGQQMGDGRSWEEALKRLSA